MGTQPEQPAQDVRDVAAEDAAIRVELVDHDDPELLEQLEPLRVVGQDRRVEHVRVRHDDLAGGPDRRADRGRGVPVVGRRGDAQVGRPGQLRQLGDLVLAEGLGREQEEGPGGRVVGEGLERRQRVAQGLARGRRRDHHDVLTGPDGLDRSGLVDVELGDPAFGERARIRGSSQSGSGAVWAARAAMTSWWRTPPANDGSVRSSARTSSTDAGA